MIKSITVTNYLDESITLELSRPDKSGLAVKSVNGLGPVKATINTTEITTDDGSLYNSARLGQRNIVMSLGFLWDPLIEDARHKTYKYFPLKKKVNLVIETDRRTVEIDGYVESNEPDIFSANEGNSVSIICPDPNFKAYGGAVQTPFYTITPLFEFPFENDSLTKPMLEFGNIEDYVTRIIRYDGDEEVGIKLIFNVLGPVGNIAFRNVRTREAIFFDVNRLRLLTGRPIGAGDEITISTIPGEKGAWLLRNGIVTNVLNCLSKDTDWFKLAKGDNELFYEAEEGRDNLRITVENDILYTGV